MVRAADLMEDPVTKGCYAECVRQGTCAEPVADPDDPNHAPWNDVSRAHEPVPATYAQAVAFCRWFGGRLPTLSELTRALSGEGKSLAPASLVRALLGCDGGDKSAECDRLRQMAPGGGTPVLPVGTFPEDVGVFGHRDLFGSVAQWTQTSRTFQQDHSDGKDPDGSEEPLPMAAWNGWRNVFQWAPSVLGVNRVPPAPAAALVPAHTGDLTTSLLRYDLGFRCAF